MNGNRTRLVSLTGRLAVRVVQHWTVILFYFNIWYKMYFEGYGNKQSIFAVAVRFGFVIDFHNLYYKYMHQEAVKSFIHCFIYAKLY